MTSSPSPSRTRKTATDRRAEIVRAAGTVALAEGLESVTLRRVADELGVRPGLISHYFPAAEELVATAFGATASAELDELLPASDAPPMERFRRFFAAAIGEMFDDVSRLWLNARHLSRYRPVLSAEVNRQQDNWHGRLTAVIADGIAAGEFRAGDAAVAATRILVAVDGVSTYVNVGQIPPEAAAFAVLTAERELGLPTGSL
ncbi:AcrR family transcriptional regulator [Actinoplanes octamycinicus]|uniref:AcrR family transcriptional regulator n=1 Tax=Actinoplanes octamycinicus TaxID=135948 RepID=A0A7W7GXN5_9ACTN|nr:TetR family transcriptional regulator C-terminal domain-containing protein [Actinoplanes octamycinicus]MBB4740173.1 AcrR family transcriptional regulator [Actinoplanes octamycinicus]GIE59570.1 transcriptional regulator [Actinoplanes octamycinicus]